MNIPTLHTQKITLRYGEHTIIRDLTLDIFRPEIVTIIGPNGSGKSTLLKALCRLLEPASGADYVVTATKTQLEKKEVPTAVQVVTQEEMKQMGAYSVQDALKYATSIDVQSFGMTGNQVMVRGMDTMHSLILVDGKRMADEDTPATQNVYVLNRINMADVERIEIIRGAGSAIYGSEAMGGVINIITKKASSPNAVVGFSTGSKETSEYFNYASGRQGKVAVKIDGRRTKVRERFSSPGNSNQFGNKLYFNADVDYAFDENRGLDITAGYMKEKLQTNAASTSATYGLSTQNQSYNQERKDFGLMYYGKDQKNDYSFRTYYSELSKDQTAIKTYKDRPYSTVFGSFLNTNDEHKFKKLVVEGKDTYTANENNKVTYGAEYKHETSDRTYRSLFLPVMPWGVGVSDHTIDTYAAYVQDEIQLGDKLLVIPALHWDYHDQFGSEITAKLGSTYSLNANNRIKFNVGTGYRAPTLYELYANMQKAMGGMTVNVVGNPDLQPEKSFDVDFSFEGESGKANYKVSPFYNRIKDMINSSDTKYYDADGTLLNKYIPGLAVRADSSYENINKAEIFGTEVEFGYNFDGHWNLMTNYTYLSAKDKDTDERLSSRAKHSGAIKLSCTDAEENPLTATLANKWYVDYRYSGEDYTYNTVNFIVNKVINKNCRVYAGVDNIFDKDLGENLWIDGRTWRVGAEMTF